MKNQHTLPTPSEKETSPESASLKVDQQTPPLPQEINGPKGPEPTRFGDWERKGRCVDF